MENIGVILTRRRYLELGDSCQSRGIFFKEAQKFGIEAEEMDKADFLRDVFLFGSMKEKTYPKISAHIFLCLI